MLVLTVVQATVSLILDVLMFMMFLRAVISWIPGMDDSTLGDFLYTITDWVIAPVRALMEAVGLDGPAIIDIPFFVTFLIISVASSFI